MKVLMNFPCDYLVFEGHDLLKPCFVPQKSPVAHLMATQLWIVFKRTDNPAAAWQAYEESERA